MPPLFLIGFIFFPQQYCENLLSVPKSPELLIPKLVQHIKSKNSETKFRIKLLKTLTKMLDRPELTPESEVIRRKEHAHYFGRKKFLVETEQFRIQNKLNDFGVSNLVTEVAISEDGILSFCPFEREKERENLTTIFF